MESTKTITQKGESLKASAEAALKESNSRLELAMQSANIAWWEMNIITGNVVFEKRKAEMLGYSPEHFKHYEDFMALVHPDDYDKAMNAMRGHFTGKFDKYEVEYRILTKSGEYKWFYDIGSITKNKSTGQPIMVMGIVIDITERKQAEAEKHELQKQLFEAHKQESLSVIAGGIAHNFNNYIAATLGNLEYLDFIDIDNPEITETIEKAKNGLKKAAGLTKQLMAYAGKAFHELTEVGLNAIIISDIEHMKTNITKDIRFEFDLKKDLPFVKGDEKQLKQIVNHLVANACEAVEDQNGIIKITTGIEYYDEKALSKCLMPVKPVSGNFVIMQISDNGCGMNETVINRIFDPFFSTKFTGRGMSMPAVQGIITAHQGGILIDSAIGLGTAITVLLPVQHPDISVVIKPVKQSVIKSKMQKYQGTLLVVDDEPDVLEMHAAILNRFGFTVLTATDGLEALKIYQENSGKIDGLILDIVMPKLDGIGVAKAVREISNSVKIVIVSGYNPDGEAIKNAHIGHDAFISKPFDLNILKETISQVFAGLAIN